MELDEKEALKGHVSAFDIECAIVDAINVYLREVLEPNKIINKAADKEYPDLAGSERNSLKYKIAMRGALLCLGKVDVWNFR